MVDLDLIPVAQCSSNSYFQKDIEGSKGNSYTVTLYKGTSECTCPGFKFRGKCKHIEKAYESFCGWHSQFDDEELKDNKKCPRCGEEVEYVLFGV